MDNQAIAADLKIAATALSSAIERLGGQAPTTELSNPPLPLAEPATAAPKTVTMGKMHKDQWITMEVDPNSTTARAEGWSATAKPPVVVQTVAPEVLETVAELNPGLAAMMKDASPFMGWFMKWLESNVKGQTPTKLNGNQLGVVAVEGEIMITRLHKAAVAAQEANGFKLSCQEGDKPCTRGARRDCPVREARRVLAAQPDFPLRKAEEKGGPYGGLFVYDGFA